MLVDEIWKLDFEHYAYSVNGVIYVADLEEQIGCDYCGGIHQSGSCR